MMFGENILSRVPADWQLNNGYMTSAIIALLNTEILEGVGA
jgi:hypothetical protein